MTELDALIYAAFVFLGVAGVWLLCVEWGGKKQ